MSDIGGTLDNMEPQMDGVVNGRDVQGRIPGETDVVPLPSVDVDVTLCTVFFRGQGILTSRQTVRHKRISTPFS